MRDGSLELINSEATLILIPCGSTRILSPISKLSILFSRARTLPPDRRRPRPACLGAGFSFLASNGAIQTALHMLCIYRLHSLMPLPQHISAPVRVAYQPRPIVLDPLNPPLSSPGANHACAMLGGRRPMGRGYSPRRRTGCGQHHHNSRQHLLHLQCRERLTTFAALLWGENCALLPRGFCFQQSLDNFANKLCDNDFSKSI